MVFLSGWYSCLKRAFAPHVPRVQFSSTHRWLRHTYNCLLTMWHAPSSARTEPASHPDISALVAAWLFAICWLFAVVLFVYLNSTTFSQHAVVRCSLGSLAHYTNTAKKFLSSYIRHRLNLPRFIAPTEVLHTENATSHPLKLTTWGVRYLADPARTFNPREAAW